MGQKFDIWPNIDSPKLQELEIWTFDMHDLCKEQYLTNKFVQQRVRYKVHVLSLTFGQEIKKK